MPIHFYCNWTFEINPTDNIFLASNIQIFIVIYLYINLNISTDVQYLWLLLSLCSLSYYSSSACLEVLQSHVWAISSSFYFGHKSFKASVQPKSFNYIFNYPTSNPIHPPWLITKPSWFIGSTSCHACWWRRHHWWWRCWPFLRCSPWSCRQCRPCCWHSHTC